MFDITKPPPSNLEAEISVLGACIVSRDACEDAMDMLHPADFYCTAHKHIFAAVQAVYNDRKPVDLITLADELRRRKLLDVVGGVSYLTSAADRVPSTGNTEYYAQIVRGDSMLRGMITACSAGVDLCYSQPESRAEAVAAIEESVLRISEHRSERITPIGEIMRVAVDRVENGQTGEPFLSRNLTRYTGGGMRPGEYSLLLGFRGSGKTRFLLSDVRNSCRAGEPYLVFSLEMSRVQIGLALAAMELNVPIEMMQNDFMGDISMDDIRGAANAVASWPLLIDDRPKLHVNDMLAVARRAKKRHGIRRIGIDYAQKVKADGANSYEQLVGVAEGVKTIAKTLDLPVLMLAQLTHEGRPGKGANIGDVHAKGAIALEDEAETVLVLNRPGQSDDDDSLELRAAWNGRAQIKCIKNRGGIRCGDVIPVGWLDGVGRVFDLEGDDS